MKKYQNEASIRKHISKLSWADLLEASELLKLLINGRDLINVSSIPSSLRPVVDYCDSLPAGTRYRSINSLLNETNAIIVSKNRTHVSVTYDDLRLYQKIMGDGHIDLSLRPKPEAAMQAQIDPKKAAALRGILPSKRRRAKLKMLREWNAAAKKDGKF